MSNKFISSKICTILFIITTFFLTGCAHEFTPKPSEESTEKLYLAALSSNEQALIEAVNEGGDINKVETELLGTASPLVISYKNYHSKRFINRILSYDIDPDFVDLSGETVFYEVIKTGDKNGFYSLLDKGADVNFIGKSGDNSIEKAIRAERYDYIKPLIEHGAVVTESNIKAIIDRLKHFTVFMDSEIKLEMIEALDLLINNYTSDYPDKNLYAAYTDSFTDMNRCKNDIVLYGITAECNKNTLNKFIDKNTDIDFLVRVAVMSGNLENAKYLIEKGANIRYIEDKGYFNALRYAVKSGNYEMTEYIMSLNSEDINECVHIAVENNNLDMIKLLAENGADINNQPAFSEAMRNGYNDIIEYFVINGFDVSSEDHSSLEKYYIEAFRLCDIDMVRLIHKFSNKTLSETELLKAVENSVDQGSLELLYYLKELGADFTKYYTYEDGSGERPLDIAIQNGYLDITIFLVENGAALGLPDKEDEDWITNYVKLSDDIFIYLTENGIIDK